MTEFPENLIFTRSLVGLGYNSNCFANMGSSIPTKQLSEIVTLISGEMVTHPKLLVTVTLYLYVLSFSSFNGLIPIVYNLLESLYPLGPHILHK